MLMLFIGSSVISAGDIKVAINKINRGIEKMMIAGDVEAQLKIYTDDAYSLPNFSPMMHGKAEFLATHKQNEGMGYKCTYFKLESVDVIEGENLVIDIGKYSLTMTMNGMPAPIEDAGKYVTVYEKQDDGTLKVKVETWNADSIPAGDMSGSGEHGEEHGGEHGME